MAVRTATGGKADWSTDNTVFDNIPEVRKWTTKPKADAKEYASSSTAGKKKRLPGVGDFDGSIDFYVDEATRIDSMFQPGDVGYLKLYEDATTFFIAPVYIDDISYETDIEGGNIVGGTVSFSGNGDLTYPT